MIFFRQKENSCLKRYVTKLWTFQALVTGGALLHQNFGKVTFKVRSTFTWILEQHPIINVWLMPRLPFPWWNRFCTIQITLRLRWWEPRKKRLTIRLSLLTSIIWSSNTIKFRLITSVKMGIPLQSRRNSLDEFNVWYGHKHFFIRRLPLWITPNDPLRGKVNCLWSLL